MRIIVCDDEKEVYNKLIEITENEKPDVIFTTGGTGFPRPLPGPAQAAIR